MSIVFIPFSAFLIYQKGIYSNGTKLFNILPHSIKNLSDDLNNLN